MSKNLSKFLSVVFGALTFLSALIQILTLRQGWAIMVTFMLLTLLSAAAFGFFLWKSRYGIVGRELKRLRRRELPGAKLRKVETEAELREIWEINERIYGEHNVTFEKARSWWRAYEDGVHVLRQGATLVGYLSMWPVKKATFRDLTSGRRREQELAPQSIIRKSSESPRTYWYITNIVVMNQFRRQGGGHVLLGEALSVWRKDANLADKVMVCAQACNRDGEVMLRSFGFHKCADADEARDRFPIYTLKASAHDLDHILKDFEPARDDRPRLVGRE